MKKKQRLGEGEEGDDKCSEVHNRMKDPRRTFSQMFSQMVEKVKSLVKWWKNYEACDGKSKHVENMQRKHQEVSRAEVSDPTELPPQSC